MISLIQFPFPNRYDHVIKPPFVPGFEICGEVIEVGANVKTLANGGRVIGISKEKLGGFAEECILSEGVR